MITGQCLDSQTPGYMFKSHYDCAIAGYALSQESMRLLGQDQDYYGKDRINEERLAIRFECKELKGA
jgi:hypothetical protein